MPDAVIGVAGGHASNVHRYFSLHRDRFRTMRCQDVGLESVDTLVMVDVRRRSRLGHVESVLRRAEHHGGVRLVVWDHHPNATDDVHGDEEHVQPVGAVTSLLVSALAERNISIDADEATLFALGIHEDTGSLRYSRTSCVDADALSWLLGRGARLSVVERFLRPPLSDVEREVLVRVLEEAGNVESGASSVGVVALQLRRAPAALARVTTEAFRTLPYRALFCVYRLENGRTHIIGRAQTDRVPVGDVLKQLGGGGQPRAGSATVSDLDLRQLVQRLDDAIDTTCRDPQIVRDLMSSPVHCARPTTPLVRLANSLEQWKHRGVPIVDDNKLVGIISKRDVEAARRSGRMDLSVGSCMSGNVHTIGPDEPLGVALDNMVAHNIGRLPVVDAGRVVGILSRTDVLRSLYGEGHDED